MIRRPPRSTRTDTLFPYTTLFRSPEARISARVSSQTSEFAMPRIDIRALLGLYDPEDSTDWGPIRAAQLNAGAHLALFLLGVNVVSAALEIGRAACRERVCQYV